MRKEDVIAAAKALQSELTEWRSHMHQHPELSFQEHETTRWVANQLDGMGIRHTALPSGTGLIAKIENGEGPTIAFRAELDALPMTEQTGAPYASAIEGRMHACGHDVHTACLLGALRILIENLDGWQGTVFGIFQPGEEQLPGGAKAIVEGNLLVPQPDAVIALHVMPELEAGMVGFRPGRYMASTDELYITVHGKGGHAAMPHLAIDPIVMQAHLILALQNAVSRWSNPALPTVLSICRVQGGTTTNVIPAEVKLAGTLRTYDEAWRAELHSRLRTLVEGIAEGLGGTAEFEIRHGYPALPNDAGLTHRLRDITAELLGEDKVAELDLRPTADDFAYYAQAYQSCYFRLGTRDQGAGLTHSVHSPFFDVPQSVLPTGAGLLAWMVISGTVN